MNILEILHVIAIYVNFVNTMKHTIKNIKFRRKSPGPTIPDCSFIELWTWAEERVLMKLTLPAR